LDLISSDYVARGTRLHYYRTGGSKPPMLLAHGISDDGLCWTALAEALRAQFDMVMVDLRGHGRSAAPEGGYTLENMAAELADLIAGLGLERPILLGHSMGANTILTLAGLYPDMPRAILLEDPPAFWRAAAPSPDEIKFRQSLAEWILSNKRKTGADLLAEVRSDNPGWSEVEQEAWINSKHRFSSKILALVDMNDTAPPNFSNLIRRITCPALFISADVKRGAACRPRDIAELKDYLPQLQVAHIANAGHSIRRDQFTRYLDVVRQACAGFG
jgi:pimeloyl-ACP methyl ester carboxylesterase